MPVTQLSLLVQKCVMMQEFVQAYMSNHEDHVFRIHFIMLNDLNVLIMEYEEFCFAMYSITL